MVLYRELKYFVCMYKLKESYSVIWRDGVRLGNRKWNSKNISSYIPVEWKPVYRHQLWPSTHALFTTVFFGQLWYFTIQSLQHVPTVLVALFQACWRRLTWFENWQNGKLSNCSEKHIRSTHHIYCNFDPDPSNVMYMTTATKAPK